MIWGARVDLQIAILGVIFPFVIGTLVGTVAGYFGGIVDTLVMRLVDIILAFPFLVLMLAIIAILGPGLTSFYIAMALVGWVSYARLIRAQILVLKSSDFAVAAVSLGFSRPRIMFRHLLPNAIAGSLVFAMSDAVLVLLNGAAISYLGLGVQPPTAEWGVMVAEGQPFITTAWWITLFPGPRHRRCWPSASACSATAWRHPGRARMTAPLLSVRDLTVELQDRAGARRLIDGVSFDLGRGEILGLVGESGSGKSLLCRALVRLLPSPALRITAGAVLLEGRDLMQRDRGRRCARCAAARSA